MVDELLVSPRKALRRFVNQHPTHAAAAEALRISKSHLSRMIRGQRGISARIMRKLGYRSKTAWERAL